MYVMFKSIVTALHFSRLKSQIKRAVQKTKHPRKNKRVLLAPTHLRIGSAFCFPSPARDEASGNSQSQKS